MIFSCVIVQIYKNHTEQGGFNEFVGLSIILDTIIKKFDRRKPFEGTHRTVVCST